METRKEKKWYAVPVPDKISTILLQTLMKKCILAK